VSEDSLPRKGVREFCNKESSKDWLTIPIGRGIRMMFVGANPNRLLCPFGSYTSAALPRTRAWRALIGELVFGSVATLSDPGRAKQMVNSSADIARLITDMADRPAMANKVISLLSKSFDLAEVWGWRHRSHSSQRLR